MKYSEKIIKGIDNGSIDTDDLKTDKKEQAKLARQLRKLGLL